MRIPIKATAREPIKQAGYISATSDTQHSPSCETQPVHTSGSKTEVSQRQRHFRCASDSGRIVADNGHHRHKPPRLAQAEGCCGWVGWKPLVSSIDLPQCQIQLLGASVTLGEVLRRPPLSNRPLLDGPAAQRLRGFPSFETGRKTGPVAGLAKAVQ